MDEHYPVFVDGHELSPFEIEELATVCEYDFEMEVPQQPVWLN